MRSESGQTAMKRLATIRSLASRFERLASVPAWFSAACLFVLMLLTFADVILRSIFSAPLGYSAEVTQLFMGIIVFAALPLAAVRDEHIVVDLFDGFFTGRMVNVQRILIDLLCLFLLAVAGHRIWELGARSRGYGEVTEILRLPQYLLIQFFSLAVAFTCLIYAARIVSAFANVVSGPENSKVDITSKEDNPS